VSDWKKKCLVEANWAKKKHTLTYLKGHTASITAVSSSDNLVFSGSIDTYVKVWKVDKQQNISTMKHTHTVRAIEFDKKHSRLMSASDNTVKIWGM
jgi:WD40 repeat protein